MSLLRPGVIKQHKPNQTSFTSTINISFLLELISEEKKTVTDEHDFNPVQVF